MELLKFESKESVLIKKYPQVEFKFKGLVSREYIDISSLTLKFTNKLLNYGTDFDNFMNTKPGTLEYSQHLKSLLKHFHNSAVFTLGKSAQDPSGKNLVFSGILEISNFMEGLNTGQNSYYAGWCDHMVSNIRVTPNFNAKDYQVTTQAILIKRYLASDGSYRNGTGYYTIKWRDDKIIGYLLDNRMYTRISDIEEGVIPYS